MRRIVFGSTGGVYGRPLELPVTEAAPCLPIDPYAASKLAAEHMGRVLCERAGVEFVAGRIFNVVGPGQDERHVCGRLASDIAAIAGGRKPPWITVHNIDHTRDYVDVRDTTSALVALARAGCAGGVCNIGSGVESSVGRVLETLISEAGLTNRVEIRRAENLPGIERHVASVEKLSSIGCVSRFDLRRSLRDVLACYRERDAIRREVPDEVVHTLARD